MKKRRFYQFTSQELTDMYINLPKYMGLQTELKEEMKLRISIEDNLIELKQKIQSIFNQIEEIETKFNLKQQQK